MELQSQLWVPVHCILFPHLLMTNLFERLTHSGLELWMEILGNSDHWFFSIYNSIKLPIVGSCAISIRSVLALIEKLSAITPVGYDPLFLRALFIYFWHFFLSIILNSFLKCILLEDRIWALKGASSLKIQSKIKSGVQVGNHGFCLPASCQIITNFLWSTSYTQNAFLHAMLFNCHTSPVS